MLIVELSNLGLTTANLICTAVTESVTDPVCADTLPVTTHRLQTGQTAWGVEETAHEIYRECKYYQTTKIIEVNMSVTKSKIINKLNQ